MTEYEKIAKLMEKASVSEDEAHTALEENGWDLLDAIVALERDGKVAGSTAQHSTRTEEAAPEPEPEPRSRFSERTVSFREQVRKSSPSATATTLSCSTTASRRCPCRLPFWLFWCCA